MTNASFFVNFDSRFSDLRLQDATSETCSPACEQEQGQSDCPALPGEYMQAMAAMGGAGLGQPLASRRAHNDHAQQSSTEEQQATGLGGGGHKADVGHALLEEELVIHLAES